MDRKREQGDQRRQASRARSIKGLLKKGLGQDRGGGTMRGKGLIVCPYSGLETPRDQCDMEHIVPRALGGRRGRGDILVRKKTNSDIGAKVDGMLLQDPDFSWARVRAGSKGNKGNDPSIHYRGYGGKDAVKNFFNPTVAPTHVFKKRLSLPPSVKEIRGKNQALTDLSDTVFVVGLHFQHLARLKFTIKTLLGMNRLLFSDQLHDHIDIPALQRLLVAGLGKTASASTSITKGVSGNGISYSDPVLPDLPASEITEMKRLKSILEIGQGCKILAEEAEGRLKWSVSILGKMVGTISIPENGRFLGETADKAAMLWELQRGGFASSAIEQPWCAQSCAPIR